MYLKTPRRQRVLLYRKSFRNARLFAVSSRLRSITIDYYQQISEQIVHVRFVLDSKIELVEKTSVLARENWIVSKPIDVILQRL